MWELSMDLPTSPPSRTGAAASAIAPAARAGRPCRSQDLVERWLGTALLLVLFGLLNATAALDVAGEIKDSLLTVYVGSLVVNRCAVIVIAVSLVRLPSYAGGQSQQSIRGSGPSLTSAAA